MYRTSGIFRSDSRKARAVVSSVLSMNDLSSRQNSAGNASR